MRPRGRLRHLVTQKEARKFGKQFNPWQLYKHVSGVNAIRLRKLLSTLEGEDYPANPRGAFHQLRQATLGDQLLDRDYRIILDDGRIRHLRGTARAMRDIDGKPIRLIGANWDITELRELAANLAEDRSLLSVTLEGSVG